MPGLRPVERRLDVERGGEVARSQSPDRGDEDAGLGLRVGLDAVATAAAGEGAVVGANGDFGGTRRVVVEVVELVGPAAARLHRAVVAGAAACLDERERDPVAGDQLPVDPVLKPRYVDALEARGTCPRDAAAADRQRRGQRPGPCPEAHRYWPVSRK